MKRLTPAELTVKVQEGIPFEELLEYIQPLVYKYSSRHILGYEQEDLAQELRLVAYECQSIYDTSKGSFLNLLIQSFVNRLVSLKESYLVNNVPVTRMTCATEDCPVTIAPKGRGPKCPSCGFAKWEPTYDPYAIKSLDTSPEGREFDDLIIDNENYITRIEDSSINRVALDELYLKLDDKDRLTITEFRKTGKISWGAKVRLRKNAAKAV